MASSTEDSVAISYEELSVLYNQCESDRQRLKRELEVLTQETWALHYTEECLMKNNKEIKKLKDELKEVEKKRVEEQSQIMKKTEEQSKTVQKIESTKQRIASLEQDAESLKECNEDLQAQLVEAEAIIAENANQLISYKQYIFELEHKEKDALKQCDQAISEMRELSAEFFKKEKERCSLQDLMQNFAKTETLEQAAQESNEKMTSLNEEVQCLKKELQETVSEREFLEKMSLDLARKSKDLEEGLPDWELKRIDACKKRDVVRSQLTEVGKALGVIFEFQNDGFQAVKRAVSSVKDARDAAVNELQNEKAKWNEESSQMEREVKGLSEDVDKLQSMMVQLISERDLVSRSVDSMKDKHKMLSEEITKAENKLKVTNKEREDMKKLEERQIAINRLEAKMQINEKENIICDLKENIDTLRAENESSERIFAFFRRRRARR